ncbi:DUF4148 domain-containing protein [Paraburkholderia sp.]|uniref:DUF4148 domain-containing protein n=1 Tax=Paraburkholderia sp. TaxID=1926495 RepID=UPI00239B1857|nr:DUF4148 domain-containing protein [Paraburkholderia sp.]MDE1182344.1 DUF4148 domain-containing protein [Paraburkholderia sp.]
MKTLFPAVALGCALAIPMLASAQTDSGADPVTRAEVRADLARLEQAGYQSRATEANYPADIQAAEAKVAANQIASASTQAPGVGSVGGVAPGSTESGSRAIDMNPPTPAQ